MLAKLVVWGEDRERASAELAAALAECEVAGVATNVEFLQRVVLHQAFASGRVHTGLIEAHRGELFPVATPLPGRALAIAAAAEYLALRGGAERTNAASSDPHSPWSALDGFTPNRPPAGIAMTFADGEALHDVRVVAHGGDALTLVTADGETPIRAAGRDGRLVVDDGEARVDAAVVRIGSDRIVFANGLRRRLRHVDPLAHASDDEPHAGHLMAPMSGTIVAVFVKPGDRVAKGAPLVALEAMKMEHTIAAPAEGVVVAVNCGVGERVSEGADLVDLGEPD